MSNLAVLDGDLTVPPFGGGYSPFLRLIVLDIKIITIIERIAAWSELYSILEHEILHEVLYKHLGWSISELLDNIHEEVSTIEKETEET